MYNCLTPVHFKGLKQHSEPAWSRPIGATGKICWY